MGCSTSAAGYQGRGTLRLLSFSTLALTLILGVTGCASQQTPPGGPVDEDAPVLTRVRPDSNATGVRAGAVGFEFDEVISERPQGSESLADLFMISPSTGPNSVSWKRTRLEVRPRGGLRENTTYTVVMLPGLTDLEGNVDSVGTKVVFSTGPTLATGRIKGIAFDWLADRAAPRAYVEAITLPDSVRYLGYADSTGRYEINHLPAGRYLVRAIVDQNRNRQLDPREIHDTMSVALIDSIDGRLHMVMRDTIGPGIESIEVVDSLTIRVRFDRAIDTSFVIAPAAFSVKRADSSVAALSAAIGGRVRQRQIDDSVRAAAARDSVVRAQRADSARRADSLRTGRAPPQPPPQQRPPADTTPPPLRPSVKIPETEAILRFQSPLAPQSGFRLRAEDIPSVSRVRRTSERTFTTPRARQQDSTARDTTARDTSSRSLTSLKGVVRLGRPATARVLSPTPLDSH